MHQNCKGLTALHLALKKNSDRRHVEMLLRRDKTYFTLLSRRPLGPS